MIPGELQLRMVCAPLIALHWILCGEVQLETQTISDTQCGMIPMSSWLLRDIKRVYVRIRSVYCIFIYLRAVLNQSCQMNVDIKIPKGKNRNQENLKN